MEVVGRKDRKEPDTYTTSLSPQVALEVQISKLAYQCSLWTWQTMGCGPNLPCLLLYGLHTKSGFSIWSVDGLSYPCLPLDPLDLKYVPVRKSLLTLVQSSGAPGSCPLTWQTTVGRGSWLSLAYPYCSTWRYPSLFSPSPAALRFTSVERASQRSWRRGIFLIKIPQHERCPLWSPGAAIASRGSCFQLIVTCGKSTMDV